MGPFSKKSDEQTTSANDNVTTNVSNDTSPRETVTTTTSQPVVRKEKHSKAFSFVSVLLLLMLLIAGVMAYMWYDQKARNESLSQDVSTAEKTISDLRSKVSTGADPDAPVASEPVKTDDELIKESVTLYNHAFTSLEKAKFNVNVSKKDGNFALAKFADASSQAGGTCLVKKVDDTWLVLYCGQNVAPQSDLDAWGVPKSFMTGA